MFDQLRVGSVFIDFEGDQMLVLSLGVDMSAPYVKCLFYSTSSSRVVIVKWYSFDFIDSNFKLVVV